MTITEKTINKITVLIATAFLTIITFGICVLIANVLELGKILN